MPYLGLWIYSCAEVDTYMKTCLAEHLKVEHLQYLNTFLGHKYFTLTLIGQHSVWPCITWTPVNPQPGFSLGFFPGCHSDRTDHNIGYKRTYFPPKASYSIRKSQNWQNFTLSHLSQGIIFVLKGKMMHIGVNESQTSKWPCGSLTLIKWTMRNCKIPCFRGVVPYCFSLNSTWTLHC